jgi:hypothetical protein
MRSAGMRIAGIIDEIAAVECEPSHTRTFTRGINPASDAAPTTRWGGRSDLRRESDRK